MDPLHIVLGFAAGMLTGMIGMGTTAILTPALLLMGVKPFTVVGTTLVFGTFTKLVSAAAHWRQGTVDRDLLRRLALGSLPGGLLGVWIVTLLPRHGLSADLYVRRGVGAVLVMIALVFALRSAGVRDFRARITRDALRRLLTLWGAVSGLAVSMTSIGSGSLVTPFLLAVSPTGPEKTGRAVGTSLAHATLLTAVTGAAYLQLGGVHWPLAISLLLGSIPGSFVGSYVMPRAPGRLVRMALAVALFATGVKLI